MVLQSPSVLPRSMALWPAWSGRARRIRLAGRVVCDPASCGRFCSSSGSLELALFRACGQVPDEGVWPLSCTELALFRTAAPRLLCHRRRQIGFVSQNAPWLLRRADTDHHRPGRANWLCFRQGTTHQLFRKPFRMNHLAPLRLPGNWLCFAQSVLLMPAACSLLPILQQLALFGAVDPARSDAVRRFPGSLRLALFCMITVTWIRGSCGDCPFDEDVSVTSHSPVPPS